MSYDAAVSVQKEVENLCHHNKSVVMVGIENVGGKFGIIVGATHPADIDLPKELDGVSIRIIQQDMPSTQEYRIREY